MKLKKNIFNQTSWNLNKYVNYKIDIKLQKIEKNIFKFETIQQNF